jgi:hypothetical protein
MFSDPMEPRAIINDVIRRSLRSMRFEERISYGLANCIEGKIWEEFLSNKKVGNIELDFRLSFEDVSKEGEKREFIVVIKHLVNGKEVSESMLREAMRMIEEPEPRVTPADYCSCEPHFLDSDKVHCVYCGKVVKNAG